jgi:hypothetical protein
MNKVILTLFALSTALPIAPMASAQKYDFTYTGSDFTASDWLTIGGAPSQDGNYESAADLARSGSTFFLVANPAGGRDGFGSSGIFPNLEGASTFEYDDFFFASRAKDAGPDIFGLLFGNAFETEFIHNRGNRKDDFDSFWTIIDHRLNRWDRDKDRDDGDDGNGGGFPPTPVPEYGGLSMLILSALALLGGFLFKARRHLLPFADGCKPFHL